MRSLLYFPLRVIGGSDAMSCKHCPWFSRAWNGGGGPGSPSAHTGQWAGFVQDSEAGWPQGDKWRHGEDAVSWWPASAWPSNPWNPATWPSVPAHSVIRNRHQLPQAQMLSLYILLAVDMAKIVSDVLGKLCRTWLILDSSFLKFILSIRPPFDFIPGPKTPPISYVYIFLTKKVL